MFLAAAVVNATPALAQCPGIGDSGTQHLTLSAVKADGSCSVDDHGYVKQNQSYTVHIHATSSGGCQTRVWHAPNQCVNSTYYPRALGATTLFDSTYSPTLYFAVVQPTNFSNIMLIDTTTSTGTSSTGAGWSTSTYSTLGEHVITSKTNVNATPCGLSPTVFPQDEALTVNVLKCEPKWGTDSNGNIGHLVPPTPPDTVQVFLDPSTLSAASTALDAAISSWNSQVSTTGLVFDRVSSSCGTGPSCITVQAVSGLGSCGYSPAVATDSSGGVVGSIYLQIDSSWNSWSPDSLERTFDHELGHRLGLGGC
jgi:hypothetical protein